jgi:hypothetical protein
LLHVLPRRAERDANPDLARPLADAERDHAVDANDGKQERDRAETG